MNKGNLILHCGCAAVDEACMRRLRTPEATARYSPIPHMDLADTVREIVLKAAPHMDFAGWQFGISHEGNRMFGVAQFKDPDVEDLCYAVGMRNSHDRSLTAALAMGGQVFVCDNMCFSGDVMMMQAHTHEPLLTIRRQMLGYYAEHGLAQWTELQSMRSMLQSTRIGLDGGYAMIGKALGRTIMTATIANECYREWRKPTYDDFGELNFWALYNAGTLAMKKAPINAQFAMQKDWNDLIRDAAYRQNRGFTR